MSRESDSSSSGPQGRGGAAYPSGTQPYGSPGGNADEAAARPEEPKTETTLTTRIKINIPGSRPIPPVVVRKPVGEESGMGAPAAPGGPAGSPGPSAPARGAERSGERTANTPRPEAAGDAPTTGGPGDKTSDWFAPRKPGAGPGGGSSTGSHQVPPAPSGATPPRGTSGATSPNRPDLPYFSDGQGAPGGASPYDTGAGQTSTPFDTGAPTGGSPFESTPFDGGGPRGGSPFDAPAAPARPRSPFDSPLGDPAGPSGPTTGPARGDSALNLPPGFSEPEAPGVPGRPDDTAELTPQPPAPPLAGPGRGMGVTGGISGGLPGSAAAGPGAPGSTAAGPGAPKKKRGRPSGVPGAVGTDDGARGSAPGGRVSGDTLVSGIPTTSDGPSSPSPFASHPADADDSAAPPSRRAIPEPIKPPKKGRNKIVLVGVGLVALVGVAYGAGLLLDHADVPNGTTALGIDIGGTSKDEAVKKLEKGLGDRLTAPLKLTVGGKPVTLQPAKAGLSIDLQATVRKAAGRDYNPVSVIGSLFGGTRVADPAVVVDDEKLGVALQNLAGPAAAAKDGGISFVNGKAVPHYGVPYKSIDTGASQTKLADAYRDRASTGSDTTVDLAATTQQPKVGKAAVDKAMKLFAEPAMSGLVTVRTDAGHAVSFSPQKSIPKFLSFTPTADGQLTIHYNLPVLEHLYGDTFNGQTVTTGSGQKKPVTPNMVASAVSKALQGRTPAERVQTIGADAP
ncbi:hypothetical protein [Streptomyces gilvosporeus]|uniref:Peptidoglycan binding domain-containing protein n=1 Tax=Streptomyces gilvosporeus TaxID=553510 RepID=A0A1V0TWC4_9ACTN|nr:hypothetical protein [Streptomyces gilvosporeus]ARF57246.1 hypothetical protein B1H19_26505 [Streptomyces gilvosporeus]